MEEAMHFLDELKDKYLHQVEQAIEDWDYQDFSPDKRCALLENEEEFDTRDGPDESQTIKSIPKSVRKAWVGLTPDAELENFDCAQAAVKLCGYESKLVAVCTSPGGIQGIPDAESVRRLLAQIPRLDAANVTAAFAARLQDDDAQHSWQVRAKAIVLMQMLAEIKPFAGRYIPAFLADQGLLKQLEALRTGTHKPVVREGARKLLSLIRSNGANPAFIPKESPMAKPHVRHVQLGNKPKKNANKPAPQIQPQPSKLTLSPGKLAVNKVFKPDPIMSKSTALLVNHARPSLVMSPKVSQAVQASWRRRNSATKADNEDDDNLMPYQKIQPTAAARNSWIYGGGAVHTAGGGMTRQSSSITTSSSRLDSGRLSAFSFVQ